ncbi:GPW/gp25 family protein [Paenibacillus phocaensis]|uniref:GPW/gp25 family protein n=1 Tax=Paenibacillus phocaensis TaxID=1776378 RepID=UPI000839D6FB|nr:GPW/gp25 family protein [Paenibacillus phocaensis]
MQVTIISSESPDFDWVATGVDEVVQNVFTLLNTNIYEVAYERTMGLPGNLADMPLDEAIPATISRIYSLIEEFEPRAEVISVNFLGVSEEDGSLIFEVVIDV